MLFVRFHQNPCNTRWYHFLNMATCKCFRRFWWPICLQCKRNIHVTFESFKYCAVDNHANQVCIQAKGHQKRLKKTFANRHIKMMFMTYKEFHLSAVRNYDENSTIKVIVLPVSDETENFWFNQRWMICLKKILIFLGCHIFTSLLMFWCFDILCCNALIFL